MTYKAIFNMDAPLCVAGALMLDGLLAWVQAQREGLPQRLTLPSPKSFDLPIAWDDRGWHKCSRLMWGGDGVQDMQTWKKTPRFAKHRDAVAETKVVVTKGRYKAYQVPIETVFVDRAWFVFESDAPESVEAMLAEVPGLGKKVSQGYGLFKSFSVEPCEADFYAEILRPLPLELFSIEGYEDVRTGMANVNYPYWEPSTRALCALSGRRTHAPKN